ncbi:energy transducer TonB [Sphingobacteriaceae bacterium]|nr:energy transducer TonB [Sphingobacteriaceae bacterium]
MKTPFYLLAFLFTIKLTAQNNLLQVSGEIRDKKNNDALVGAIIQMKGSNVVSTTNSEGKFTLKSSSKFPFTLVVSYTGYQNQEFLVENETTKIKLELNPQTLLIDEVVVSASRTEESILKSPVAIDKLDIITIRETPAPTFFDALENVKGVQMTTGSLTFKVPNTRGFNSPNNFRFTQLVDGIDIQSPTLGMALGNTIGPNELDIKSVEIIPGSSSALYGVNSINGLSNSFTKNPFLFKGVGVYQRTGVNHVDNIDHGLSFMSESAFRIANTIGSKERFAYKFNASYFQGVDWVSSSPTDQNPYQLTSSNPKFPEFTSQNTNPAYDGWNNYGNESNNTIPVIVNYQGKTQTLNVRRTGWEEKDLVDPNVKNIKIDGALHYKPTNKVEISYKYRFGQMDGVFQRGNKIQLKNATLQNHAIEVKGQAVTFRAYTSIENTGDSYNLKPLSDNLDLSFKDNKTWGNDYKIALQNAVNAGTDLVTANQIARAKADAGRYTAGNPEFIAMQNEIVKINNWDHASLISDAPKTGGAALWQRSRLFHSDIQYDLSKYTSKYIDVLVGADARVNDVIPDGNNFVDFSKPLNERTTPGGNDVYYSKVGGFVQGTKKLLKDNLKIIGSLRYDKNFDFEGKFNPRIAIVYTFLKQHNVRVSYQDGYRFPALFEALSFVNNGGVRRVGGLPKVNDGLGFLENSYTKASIDNFSSAVNNAIAAGLTRNAAILKNKSVLEVANLQQLQPEHIQAFDAGYKAVVFKNRVVVDWDFYYNIEKGFLGQVEVGVPTSGAVGSDSAAFDAYTRQRNVRYRVFTNAKNTYFSYGSSLRLSYNFYKTYSISGNLNYNGLKTLDKNDIFITGFNTPEWSTNIQFGNRELYKHFGFNIVWKWQQNYLWESPLATGNVPSFNTFDAQISYHIPKINTVVKAGGTNILNKRYYQYAAGPTIGGLYYISVTYDLKFKNKTTDSGS